MPHTWATLLVAISMSAATVGAADFVTLFDGKDAGKWITNTGKPVPPANVQADGLNPHKSGGYIVMYDQKFKDFALDFDYKLSPGCNSGVFIRVGDPKDPVNTGLEIALDDTTGTGLHDTGAFYDLAAPRLNAQKPAGQWNHMTITAQGPRVTVVLNDQEVSRIDLSQFTQPGLRPDGTKHKFSKLAARSLDQEGYFGFQDHGQDCWFKNVKIKSPL